MGRDQAREVARTIEIQRQIDEQEAQMYGQITTLQNELNLLCNPNKINLYYCSKSNIFFLL